jgi:hypothetical protein
MAKAIALSTLQWIATFYTLILCCKDFLLIVTLAWETFLAVCKFLIILLFIIILLQLSLNFLFYWFFIFFFLLLLQWLCYKFGCFDLWLSFCYLFLLYAFIIFETFITLVITLLQLTLCLAICIWILLIFHLLIW